MDNNAVAFKVCMDLSDFKYVYDKAIKERIKHYSPDCTQDEVNEITEMVSVVLREYFRCR